MIALHALLLLLASAASAQQCPDVRGWNVAPSVTAAQCSQDLDWQLRDIDSSLRRLQAAQDENGRQMAAASCQPYPPGSAQLCNLRKVYSKNPRVNKQCEKPDDPKCPALRAERDTLRRTVAEAEDCRQRQAGDYNQCLTTAAQWVQRVQEQQQQQQSQALQQKCDAALKLYDAFRDSEKALCGSIVVNPIGGSVACGAAVKGANDAKKQMSDAGCPNTP
ncbi:MAG: hypothetical protein HY079_06180 [Elusimicrobia bacterium]|nr:hypothetical protein [Elusimicrobiota bacterium]